MIDTVHQGDLDGEKPIYDINAIDKISQFEIVVSVEKTSENYLISLLVELLSASPFVIKNFHSENDSEYIDHHVVKMLNKLRINLKKSRSKYFNNNALVEFKNGIFIRKYLRYVHIPQKFAALFNDFNKNYLTSYINFHCPYYFCKIKIDKKEKHIPVKK